MDKVIENYNEKHILNHIAEVSEAQINGKINELRNIDSGNYIVEDILFPFGTRRCAKSIVNNSYLLLQKSRGGSINLDNETHIDEKIELVKRKMTVDDKHDKHRANEFQNLLDLNVINFSDNATMVELGFRWPKLLNCYQEKYKMKTFGFDVIEANVAVAKKMGYSADLYDFNNCTKNLDLKSADLVISYHMLEHVTNPLIAVQKIYSSMKKGSYFHVEIPIEIDGPNIRYGHMYPFHPGDMKKMLEIAGFKILSINRAGKHLSHTIDNRSLIVPETERYMALKD